MNDIVNDRIDVTTKAFLGLTISCARCHDHKFDPCPTKDYYSLYGVFANTFAPKEWRMPTVRPVAKTPELLAYLAKVDDLDKQEATIDGELEALRGGGGRKPQTLAPAGTPAPTTQEARAAKRRELLNQEETVDRQIGDLEEDPQAPPRAEALFDVTVKGQSTRDYPVLLRGEAQNKGPVVPRRFLEILSGPQRPTWTKDSGRLELAEAIADPKNPLTARVIVNRIWRQHFGAGFVSTPDDLGNQSAPPTHPELLDYLANRLMEQNWSIKKLQRLIVLSATYQESSAGNSKYTDSDPDNKLLWRYNMHRMDFEEIHDSLLADAGTLNLDRSAESRSRSAARISPRGAPSTPTWTAATRPSFSPSSTSRTRTFPPDGASTPPCRSSRSSS